MFVYGAQYFRPPNPPAEDWARDLARIKEHGFNTVKYWIPWSWVHRGRDEFDFSEVDRLMDLATENQLRVVLNIILEDTPYWLEELHPEARYRAHDETLVKLTAATNTPCGGWPGLCLDNEPIRREAAKVLRQVAERYREHSALLTYDVWNEPHVEPTWYYPDKMFCYCDSSVERFKEWLQAKYSDLDSLNRAWARRFTTWSQVTPPHAFEVYPDLLDWKRFWLENLRTWLRFKTDIVRGIDSGHPVMTHVASSGYLGTLPVNTWDEWLLSEPVDLFGTSSFPKWLMNNDPAIHMFHLDSVRSAAQGKPFWQSELQAGCGPNIGPFRASHPMAEEIRMWNWNVLASGAKGLMYWSWRPELLGPESPCVGLCNVSGDPTPRTAAAAEMARFIESEPAIASSQFMESEVGIVVSRDTAILNYAAERNMDLYAKALLGTYRAFFDRDVPVSFVHTDILPRTAASQAFKYLYYPLPLVIDPQTARALELFVEQGGVLIAEACPGHFNENGWCSTRIPGQGLERLFGAREIETDRAEQIEMQLQEPVGMTNRADAIGSHYKETLEVMAPSARVVGCFPDGTAAITCNQYGQGQAYLVGSVPSIAYESLRSEAAQSLILAFTNCRTHQVSCKPFRQSVKTRLARYDGGYLLYVLNWGTEDEELEIQIKGLSLSDYRIGNSAATVEDGRMRLQVGAMNGRLVTLELEKH